MDIKRGGSQPSRKGPTEWFTGTVRIDPLFEATDPARAGGAYVTFEPGARTAWHAHPAGQTLIITAGCGRVQRWEGPIEEIRPGVAAPFEYVSLPINIMWGLVIWQEIPTLMTLVGAVLTLSGGMYILYRERRERPVKTAKNA